MRQRRGHGRAAEEIKKLVAGFERSGQSRADYAAAHGVTVSALDYYRRRARVGVSELVEIKLDGAGTAVAPGGHDVSVVLRNGRRIEMAWQLVAGLSGDGHLLSRLAACLERED